jgi:flagellar biosynthesis protein FliR
MHKAPSAFFPVQRRVITFIMPLALCSTQKIPRDLPGALHDGCFMHEVPSAFFPVQRRAFTFIMQFALCSAQKMPHDLPGAL